MTTVPNAQSSIVLDRKLTDYILSKSHPDGSTKAHFLERFGFFQVIPETLRQALLNHVRTYDVVAMRANSFGSIYEVIGPLISPDGRNPVVKVVWMIDTGTSIPRFVTLVPAKVPSP